MMAIADRTRIKKILKNLNVMERNINSMAPKSRKKESLDLCAIMDQRSGGWNNIGWHQWMYGCKWNGWIFSHISAIITGNMPRTDGLNYELSKYALVLLEDHFLNFINQRWTSSRWQKWFLNSTKRTVKIIITIEEESVCLTLVIN